jgi:hypothetical protein
MEVGQAKQASRQLLFNIAHKKIKIKKLNFFFPCRDHMMDERSWMIVADLHAPVTVPVPFFSPL